MEKREFGKLDSLFVYMTFQGGLCLGFEGLKEGI
jgi:hypothetical protein